MKYISILTVVFMFSLSGSQESRVGFNEFAIYKIDNYEEYQNWSEGRETDEATGFSFASKKRHNKKEPINVVSPEKSEDDFASTEFYFDEYVVICFTPVADLFIRLIDTTPNGITHQLYPYEDTAVQVIAGQDYCVGDAMSDVELYLDEESGIGEGLLYLYGTTIENDLNAEEDFALPSGMQSGFGFASVRRTGQSEREKGEQKIYESWIKYLAVEKP